MLERLFGSRPKAPLSPEQLEREIGRRRKEAQRCGVAEALKDLYTTSWMYVASWISTPENRRWIHPSITEARQTAGMRGIEMTVSGRRYALDVKEDRALLDQYDAETALEFSIDGTTCLGISFGVKHGEYADAYSQAFVTAFVPGDWVKDVLKLRDETKALHERRARESELDRAKRDAGRFGL
jgi:hypothetical protein